MSPTREKMTPPSSPLQRMQTPFLSSRKRPPPSSAVSRRPRSKIRIAILLLTLLATIFVLNELRCAKYGCSSRVRFHNASGSSPHVGGGAVVLGPHKVAHLDAHDAEPLTLFHVDSKPWDAAPVLSGLKALDSEAGDLVKAGGAGADDDLRLEEDILLELLAAQKQKHKASPSAEPKVDGKWTTADSFADDRTLKDEIRKIMEKEREMYLRAHGDGARVGGKSVSLKAASSAASLVSRRKGVAELGSTVLRPSQRGYGEEDAQQQDLVRVEKGHASTTSSSKRSDGEMQLVSIGTTLAGFEDEWAVIAATRGSCEGPRACEAVSL
ncbi:hypothetical protein BDV95DRAFT_597007 [Massariosphaeria phaeospora]|uniref:Uncharacterized protein n=1 Tax=Massariosphaeria phaeospora TaxID=100035 RepID=A0A7C8M8E3_9PLEO|nr:hypothetical protein BDV95DRAFT_597007 [Massariosphaeria phaeospora]